MARGISVIVCCFNSVARIVPTLTHLANQKNISLTDWEVIVVDNASTDDTAALSEQTWNAIPGDKPYFKLISELKPGLTSARKRGISESQFDYVLFCDDDNWLGENYLNTALKIMDSHPEIGALGGNGFPVFEDKEPPYFWVNQYHALAVGRQAKIDGDITDTRPVVYGAGMVVNKNAFKILRENYQFQFLLSDRVGNKLTSSGDHELCLAMVKIGYRIFSSDELKFQHYVPTGRTTIKYYKKLFYQFGRSFALLLAYRVKKDEINHIKNDYRYICLRALKNIILRYMSLFMKGYYFGINKYKHIDDLHLLYDNLGVFNTSLKSKNNFKHQFATMPLFASGDDISGGKSM